MTTRPDPTFHASPKLAMEAPPENFAYTLLLSPDFSKPDALAVIDVKPGSPTFSQIVHTVTMPYKGDEFHHFGWNACSSALSPLTGHAFLERRYLIIPGLRSSRIYVVDTKPDPTKAKIPRSSSPRRCSRRLATRGPTRFIAVRKASTSARSAVAARRAPTGRQASSSWIARHLISWVAGRSTAAPKIYIMTWESAARLHGNERVGVAAFENGVVPEDLLSNKYGHHIHFWDLRARRNVQTIDLGANHQMALEVRPAHDPIREHGFMGVVVDTTNLEGSIWTWWRKDGNSTSRRRRRSRLNRRTRISCHLSCRGSARYRRL